MALVGYSQNIFLYFEMSFWYRETLTDLHLWLCFSIKKNIPLIDALSKKFLMPGRDSINCTKQLQL